MNGLPVFVTNGVKWPLSVRSNVQLTPIHYDSTYERLNEGNALPVKIEAIDSSSVFETLHAEWNDLVQRSVSNTIFSTWEWHKHWWDAYHPGTLWIITIRSDEGVLLGIASWFLEHDAERGRVVRHVGCEDVTDYLDVIFDKSQLEACYSSLADYLVAHRDRFDVLDLCNIPEGSPTCEHFTEMLSGHGFEVKTNRQDVCPVIQLPDNWDAYLDDILDKKQRHEIRRKLRRAEGQKQMGGLEWYIVDASHNIDEEIDHFLQLMAASHPEKAEFLTDDQHVQFFRSIIPAALEQGWLQLNFLKVNDQHAAAYLNFDYGDSILVYNSGLDPQRFASLSPGIVLLSYNIQHAIELGRSTFDFLRGDENYKYRMGAQDTSIYNLKAILN